MRDANDPLFDQFDDGLGGDGGHGAVQNPLLMLHRRLRGRYLLAIVLGLALAVPGALVGWNAMPVRYAGEATIELQPSLRKVLYTTDENAVMPFFEEFVQTQSGIVRQPQVVARAAEDPKLRALGWPGPPDGAALLASALDVRPVRGSHMIYIQVTHDDPRIAQVAANAVLHSYEQQYDERSGRNATERETALQNIVRERSRELSTLREEMFRLSNNLGAETLPRRLQSKADELGQYDQLISQLELALADATVREQGEATDGADGGLTMEELALYDQELAGLLAARDELEARRDVLARNFLPNHRMMRELDRQLDELETRIARRTAVVEEQMQSEAVDVGGTELASAEQIRARLEQHRVKRAEISREVSDLGRNLRLLEGTRSDIDDLERQLDEASEALNALRVERENNNLDSGRVISYEAMLPLSPSKDRRLPLAVGGFGAGLCAGVGLVFLYGFLRPTYRFIDDVEEVDGIIPLLGTLPDFSSGDPEQRDLAALSVHHLRNALQIGNGRSAGSVLTVTSAAAGDGKTSLVMALGTSYAAAGQRTCLVDADLIGRGLTRELRYGDRDGFIQAVVSGDTEPTVSTTPVSSLWVVPAGRPGDIDPTRLSERNVRPVIESLRSRFDVVLIDTGPLLGSLEANVVCVLSDRVVLAVSRGQGARVVRAAIERLKRLSTNCAGIIFNRAAPMDFRSSVSHASIRSTSVVVRPGEEEHAPRPGSRASLMDAVAGVVQAESNGEV
jgi:Mrp family chromosome partitioning ATPase/uncharacterized protein involved in exopolysaccharide biosynthesis